MPAHEHINDYQFKYRPTGPQYSHPGYFNDSEDDADSGWSLYDHSVTAVHKPTKQVVGEMLYHADGPLFEIQVNEEHQRKGLAQGMVEHAVKLHEASGSRIPRPSRAYHETEEGEVFADTMEKRGLFKQG
jgi:GNAT superfamily N-acetyltransferase